VKPGDVVSPEMLHRMLAQLADPLTGEPLGRLPSMGQRAPVAGYDLTFHPPKSVSLMWAMGDQVTRGGIEEVMAEALGEVVSWAEDHVFFTRTGVQGARQEAIRGVVTSTWLHFESRDGDAQLHHHAVVWNRALDLYHGRAGPLGPYEIGLALDPGEVLYRQVWARYWALGTTTELVDSYGRVRVVPPAWRDWGWCHTVITSKRLATRLTADGSRLVSNWWVSIAGVQVDLARDMIVLDDRASSWRAAYGGSAAAIVAVAAVERVHGPAALVHYPALGLLRDFADRDIEPRRAQSVVAKRG